VALSPQNLNESIPVVDGAFTMKPKQVGQTKPRYLRLNPYTDVRREQMPRLTKRPTHLRSLAIFVHIDGWGPLLVLGKTCRDCTPCELVMANCDELEAETGTQPRPVVPTKPGFGLYGVGTVWNSRRAGKGSREAANAIGTCWSHLADCKNYST